MNNYTSKETDQLGNTRYYNDKDQLHRTDGPAVEWANGGKEWYVNGMPHRTDRPAVEYTNGSKHWYVNGKRHRTDGPAIEYTGGDKIWYVNGKYHRTDGPALEYADGDKAWYINGEEFTEEEFNKHPLVIERMLGKIIGEVLDE